MSVTSEDCHSIHDGSGDAATQYTLGFPLYDQSHLLVTVTDALGNVTELARPDHQPPGYSVTINANHSNGYITTMAAVATTSKLTITRKPPATQQFVFEEGGRIPTKTLEKGLDLQVMLYQWLRKYTEDAVTRLEALWKAISPTKWGTIAGTLTEQEDLRIALTATEKIANKVTGIDDNKDNNICYASVKAIYDWATGLFVQNSRTINGHALAADVTLTHADVNAQEKAVAGSAPVNAPSATLVIGTGNAAITFAAATAGLAGNAITVEVSSPVDSTSISGVVAEILTGTTGGGTGEPPLHPYVHIVPAGRARMEVSALSSPLCSGANGSYEYYAYHDSKPEYRSTDGIYSLRWSAASSIWEIIPVGNSSLAYSISHSDTATPDLATGWGVEAPVITPVASSVAQIVSAISASSAATALITAIAGGNGSGIIGTSVMTNLSGGEGGTPGTLGKIIRTGTSPDYVWYRMVSESPIVWEKLQGSDATLAAAASDATSKANAAAAASVPTTRMVNGHALSSDVTLTYSDVGAQEKSVVGIAPVNYIPAVAAQGTIDFTGVVPAQGFALYVLGHAFTWKNSPVGQFEIRVNSPSFPSSEASIFAYHVNNAGIGATAVSDANVVTITADTAGSAGNDVVLGGVMSGGSDAVTGTLGTIGKEIVVGTPPDHTVYRMVSESPIVWEKLQGSDVTLAAAASDATSKANAAHSNAIATMDSTRPLPLTLDSAPVNTESAPTGNLIVACVEFPILNGTWINHGNDGNIKDTYYRDGTERIQWVLGLDKWQIYKSSVCTLESTQDVATPDLVTSWFQVWPSSGPAQITITPETTTLSGTSGKKGQHAYVGTDVYECQAESPVRWKKLVTNDNLAAAQSESLLAARNYADSLVVGLLDDRGNFDASVNTFPTTGGSGPFGWIRKGDLWTISAVATAGPLLGYAIGDTVRALTDSPYLTASNWAITQTGLNYAPENPVNKSTSVSGDQTSSDKYPTVKALYDWAMGAFAGLTHKSRHATGGEDALSPADIGAVALTGAQSMQGPLTITAQTAATGSSAMTRDLADARYANWIDWKVFYQSISGCVAFLVNNTAGASAVYNYSSAQFPTNPFCKPGNGYDYINFNDHHIIEMMLYRIGFAGAGTGWLVIGETYNASTSGDPTKKGYGIKMTLSGVALWVHNGTALTVGAATAWTGIANNIHNLTMDFSAGVLSGTLNGVALETVSGGPTGLSAQNNCVSFQSKTGATNEAGAWGCMFPRSKVL